MTRILEAMQLYLPSKLVDIQNTIPETNLRQEKVFLNTLVGGDLLSAVRARGAIYIRSNSELQEHKLNGFCVVSEDWHAMVCFLEVCHPVIFNPCVIDLPLCFAVHLESVVQDQFINGQRNTVPAEKSYQSEECHCSSKM